MGINDIVSWINGVFANPRNFDVSGFLAYPITREIQYALGHLSDRDRKNLKKLGYEFKWFNTEMTEGIIFMWIIEKPRKIFFTRRIYFNGKDTKDGRTGRETSSEESGTH